MITTISGISFHEIPYIRTGDELIVVRERGKPWDSNARPAYAVLLEGLIIGYIPLLETIDEEIIRGTQGFKKVWKRIYEEYSRDELLEIARKLNEQGIMETFHEWRQVGVSEMMPILKRLGEKRRAVEEIRDYIYVDIERNHINPKGYARPRWFDEKHGYNSNEVGEVISIGILIDTDGTGVYNSLATMKDTMKEMDKSMERDNDRSELLLKEGNCTIQDNRVYP